MTSSNPRPNFKCEYCQKNFTRKDNLIQHQQQAKYCVKFRNAPINENTVICEYCGRELRRYSLNRHHISCVEYRIHVQVANLKEQLAEKDRIIEQMITEKNQLLADKDRIISEKDNCVERLAIRAIDRPSNTTTTRTTNKNVILQTFQPITTQFLNDQSQNLSLEHVKNGAAGYAEYAAGYPCKERVICSDPSRKRIRYKGENGEIIDDIGGINLAQKLFTAIDERNQQLISQAYNEIVIKVSELMAQGETRDIDTLTEVMKMGTKLMDMQKYCKEISEGKENELRDKFVGMLIKFLG